MVKKYHINPVSNEISECRGLFTCCFTFTGDRVEHFLSLDDALLFLKKVLDSRGVSRASLFKSMGFPSFPYEYFSFYYPANLREFSTILNEERESEDSIILYETSEWETVRVTGKPRCGLVFSGRGEVIVEDDARIEAHGNVSVFLEKGGYAQCHDNSHVLVKCGGRATLYDNSFGVAGESGSITAFDSAQVKTLGENSRITAYNEASVVVTGSKYVTLHDNATAFIAGYGHAVGDESRIVYQPFLFFNPVFTKSSEKVNL